MNAGNDDQSTLESERKLETTGVRLCAVIPSFDEFDVARYRKSLGMSQREFAQAHEISLGTLKKWEISASTPVFSHPFRKILQAWANDHSTVGLR